MICDDMKAESMAKEATQKTSKSGKYRVLTSFQSKAVCLIAIAMSVFHIYANYGGFVLQMQKNNLHIAFALVLTFFLYPATKKSKDKKFNIIDYALLFLAVAGPVYVAFRYTPEFATNSHTIVLDYFMAGITTLLVLEACRRIHGPAIPVIVFLFIFYALFASYAPGLLRFRNVPITRLLFRFYLTGEGMWGSLVTTSASFLFIFILFGAILDISGGAQAFNDIGFAIGGRMRGGPAQVAVISSALMGSISGSAVANVMTTGAFTIPLMKKMGYKDHFAASVEAAASTGGVITPPIMGSVAFIMAGNLGIPYSRIVTAAALPAVLYYIAIMVAVNLQARKQNLAGLPKEEIPSLWGVMKKQGLYLTPVLVIIFVLVQGKTPLYAGMLGILSSIVVSWTKKETRMGPKKILLAMEKGARSAVSIAIACVSCTFIVTVTTMTGLGTTLALNIVKLSGGVPFFALLFIAIIILVMSMGMPGPACYIVVSVVAVPALVAMGLNLLASHLFVMWLGTMSNLTPPVCMASFAASSLAGSQLSKTAWGGLRLAAAGLIVPFIFVFNPIMILEKATFGAYVLSFITGIVGVFALAVALHGYFRCNLPFVLRAMFFASALTLIDPSYTTDIIGTALLAISLLLSLVYEKKRIQTC